MKIEKFSVSVAVKDGMTRMEIYDRLKAAIAGACRTKADMFVPFREVDCDCGIYAIEFERFDGNAQPESNEEPRKKRKYTRRPKAPQSAEEGKGTLTVEHGEVKVRRMRSDGKVVEMRGNCQGGYAKAEAN